MAVQADGFDPSIALPPQLKISQIRAAIKHIEKRSEEFLDIYFEQANVFSAIIGILGVQALDSLSPYKKHRHPDIAQQRFPDLSLDGKLNPPPKRGVESKGSTRPWALQSHYNHEGWYIVWRYAIDQTRSLKPGRTVVIWRVDICYLRKRHWKYEKSKAGAGRGGRTHTFGVWEPAKRLKRTIVYQSPNVVIKKNRPVLWDSGE
jgi:hypothetical protein